MTSRTLRLIVCMIAVVDAVQKDVAPVQKDVAAGHGANYGEQRTFAEHLLRVNQTEAASAITRVTRMPSGPLRANVNVLYAVFTSKAPKFRAKLEAQMETWAKDAVAEGRFLAIGGRDYPTEFLKPGVVESADCNDYMGGLSCKEAHLIDAGAKRGVDWIFIIGEDNYVDTAVLEAKLRAYNPGEFQGLGCIGCGKDIASFGKEVQAQGSFCGGCGYALSKNTISKLTEMGVNNLIREYGGSNNQAMPNDMNTGSAMRKRGAKLLQFPGALEGNPTFSRHGFQTKLHDHTIVYHYMTPDQMRWLHAVKTNQLPATIAELDSTTFDDMGCALGLEKTYWAQEAHNCRRANGVYH